MLFFRPLRFEKYSYSRPLENPRAIERSGTSGAGHADTFPEPRARLVILHQVDNYKNIYKKARLTYFSCRYIEIKGESDLLAPGAKPGTIPTDIEQATGLERLELIGKMQGIDIFDMRPLDASRKGMTPLTSPSTSHRNSLIE